MCYQSGSMGSMDGSKAPEHPAGGGNKTGGSVPKGAKPTAGRDGIGAKGGKK